MTIRKIYVQHKKLLWANRLYNVRLLLKKASSPESVGEIRLRQGAEAVI